MTPKAATDPARWVEAYGDTLYRYALVRTSDSALAEDLVQETLLAALKGRDRFRGQSSECSWLIGILKHKLLDYYRHSRRELPDEAIETTADAWFDANGSWAVAPAAITNPHDAAAREELRDQLAVCIGRLPERLKTAFVLTQVDGVPTAEICKALTLTSTNLWVMLHRARLRLRQCLERAGYRGREK
ncbi:MAG: sigma-70 family RNA polymerase sigma factor [Gammaproteobacteria bacterium]